MRRLVHRRRGSLQRLVHCTLTSLALSGCLGDSTGPRSQDPYVRNHLGVRVFGDTRVPVLLAKFSNWPDSPLSSNQLEQRMFGGANGGLVNAPFSVASSGRFRLRADASDWVSTSAMSSAVGTQFVVDVITAADAELNFARYDNDGPDHTPNSGDDDGYVDGGVVILHSARDLICSTTGPNANSGPHPHAVTNWRVGDPLVAFRTSDPSRNGGMIGIKGYTIMSATDCFGVELNAGVLAHELGHLLFGLPDLYHALSGIPVPAHQRWLGRRWVVGCWELMAAGSWGCGSGTPPRPSETTTTFGAWSRSIIGWSVPVIASATLDTTYTLRAVGASGTNGTLLRIPITDTEYLLVEYREVMVGDAEIPGAGVLIYHIDDALPLRPALETGPRRYRVALVEADDDSALVRIDAEGGNRGVLADAFGRSVTSFATATHSAARTSSGDPLPFRLEEISFDLVTRTARVRVIRDPSPPPDQSSRH